MRILAAIVILFATLSPISTQAALILNVPRVVGTEPGSPRSYDSNKKRATPSKTLNQNIQTNSILSTSKPEDKPLSSQANELTQNVRSTQQEIAALWEEIARLNEVLLRLEKRLPK